MFPISLAACLATALQNYVYSTPYKTSYYSSSLEKKIEKRRKEKKRDYPPFCSRRIYSNCTVSLKREVILQNKPLFLSYQTDKSWKIYGHAQKDGKIYCTRFLRARPGLGQINTLRIVIFLLSILILYNTALYTLRSLYKTDRFN